MSYIWTFGDSFTFGHGCKSGQEYEYEKLYPLGDENLWPNLVSNHFKKDLINIKNIINNKINKKISISLGCSNIFL